jgi:hypothetical protein
MDTTVLKEPAVARKSLGYAMPKTVSLHLAKEESIQPHWANKHADAKEKIKPRGLAGLFEGRFRYDEREDIFNLKR